MARIHLLTVILLAFANCKPSATVRNATRIANLQQYRTVLVRAGAQGNAEAYIQNLEYAVSEKLRRKCRFDKITAPSETADKADLVADLTIQRVGRDSEGLIQNPNLAIVDVTMVLSDAVQNELIGSAEIRGKSSEIYTGNDIPEAQAIDAVAGRIADILVLSGCSEERIARDPSETSETQTSSSDNVDDKIKVKAEKLNDKGKEHFKSGEIAKAKSLFEQAIAEHKDARFIFNLCLAQEGLHEFQAAIATCEQVVQMKQEERLSQKATDRIEIIRAQMQEQ